MGEICQKFKSAAIVDAFAGPGAYLDGPAGSPVVIATAERPRDQRASNYRLPPA
jgi:hypothetical protein